MESVGCRQIKEVALSVEKHVHRLRERRLQAMLIAEPVLSAMFFKGPAMQDVHLFTDDKNRLVHIPLLAI